MKTKINDILIESTAQTPVLVCLLASIMPKWIFEILAVMALTIGLMMWWKYKKKTIGIISIVLALLFAIIAVTSSRQKPSSTTTEFAELGEDPLRSFFQFDQRAQEAWDTMNVSLFEEIATISLEEAVKQGSGRYSFAYYDNIWHKLEMAKNNGSMQACCNMAFMCANGLGRKRSVEDAVDLCMKAIQINPSSPYPYILLEDLCLDSSHYPNVYGLLSDWKKKNEEIDKEVEKVTRFYGLIKDDLDPIMVVNERDKSFRQVLFHDTISHYWKIIDEHKNILRTSVSLGNVSLNALYLSAYYSGKNNRDSAVYYYEKFLGADYYWRLVTGPQASLYSVIPDTVVNIFSRKMTPFLLGLSCIDLDYLARCAGTRNIPGIDTINLYLMDVADYAKALKYNRLNFQPQTNNHSDFDTISKSYILAINKLIQIKKPILGKTKSKMYKYNFAVEIHNTNSTIYSDTKKKSAFALIQLGQSDQTFLFYNLLDEKLVLEEGNNALERVDTRFHEQLVQKPY